ncbi:MAG: T9SS type A sorting domain-containing protein [Saprospiraceae bacterium]|nr:T9SS type A sorting domain-containing protein [Saprospiraceae bacterium]
MKHVFFLLILLLFIQNTLFATSIIPFRHLGEAAQVSDAVVMATMENSFETPSGDYVFFDSHLRVTERIKGDLATGDLFTLRRQDHRMGDFQADFPGDFIPEEGKTYLIFLKNSGSFWRPVTMAYYVFEVKKIGNEPFLVPVDEGLGVALVPRPDGVQPELPGVYRVNKLLHILRQYLDGITLNWDIATALTSLTPYDFPRERALPTGCDFDIGSGLCRWQNTAINLYFDDTNAPGGFSSTLDNILSALNGSYTGIDPSNAGQVSFTPDCSDATVTGNDFTSFLSSLNGNQTTLLMFDDPCNQIPNLIGCMGTLAIGGGYSSSLTHSYKGDTWKNALWGYVVVNNGTPGCLTAAQYEIMLTHELTHTYRMDHLNATLYPGQNMNPACCNAIGAKDIECMNYTYDIALPVQLTTFNIQSVERQQVKIVWTTSRETGNDHFVLERSSDGLHFEIVANLPGHNTQAPHVYEWTDIAPFPGINYYRLSQVDFDGHSSSLGIRVAEVGDRDGEVYIFPNPATEEAMTLKTDFPAAFSGTLRIVDMGGRVVEERALSLEKGENTLDQPVGQLAPGVYWLKLDGTTGNRVLKFFKN